jgi:hypothetical protein
VRAVDATRKLPGTQGCRVDFDGCQIKHVGTVAGSSFHEVTPKSAQKESVGAEFGFGFVAAKCRYWPAGGQSAPFLLYPLLSLEKPQAIVRSSFKDCFRFTFVRALGCR